MPPAEIFLDASAWRGYRRADFPWESWAVHGDALHALAGGPRTDLVSRMRFGDFDLTFAWRLPAGGNSGVLYRVSEEVEAAWQSGPEMQLLDDEVHPDGRVAATSCGALYGLHAPERWPPREAGLFNVARIRLRGSRIEHWLNDVRVLVCALASDEFHERVSGSKFDRFPLFARAAEGHLVLQHHGTDAWFRDMRITA